MNALVTFFRPLRVAYSRFLEFTPLLVRPLSDFPLDCWQASHKFYPTINILYYPNASYSSDNTRVVPGMIRKLSYSSVNRAFCGS